MRRSSALAAEGTLGPGRTLYPRVDDVPSARTSARARRAADLGERGAWTPSYTAQVGLELRGNIYDFGRTGASVEQRPRRVARRRKPRRRPRAKRSCWRCAAPTCSWLAQAELLAIAEQAADRGPQAAASACRR